MIRPRYALRLARTKLKSKRGILTTSIIVSSVLFGALIASIIVFTGIEKSAVNFVEKANNNHYLVLIQPNIPRNVTQLYENGSINLSLETVRSIKAFEKQYYKNEREKYKTAGVEYNPELEIPTLTPSDYIDKTLPDEQRVMINWSSPVINAILEQKFTEYSKIAKNKFKDIQTLGNKYGATNYYFQEYTQLQPLPSLRLIQNDKEDFTSKRIDQSQTLTADINAIHNGSYGFSDNALLTRNLLITDTKNIKGIPVIPTAQEVASTFGSQINVSTEPKDESQKLSWLKSVQEKSKGFIYQACYRNPTEQIMLDKIQSDYVEMKANVDNENYIKPSLIYNYPETACGDITIKSDTRTYTEKQNAIKLESNQKKLGTYIAPSHKLLTFEIVGLTYAQAFVYSPTNITDFTKGLLSGSGYLSSSSYTASIPTQMYKTLPESMRFDDISKDMNSSYLPLRNDEFKDSIVAFDTIDKAKNFLNDVGCRSSDTDCSKLFYTEVYGSNYLLIEEIGKLFLQVISIAFPVLLGLSLIIIWFTISRIMRENRKETAIYRAMGARRIDIAAIYITYMILVALRIALLSLIFGISTAYILNIIYAPDINSTASSVFGIIGNAPAFTMFDPSSPFLWIVIGLIFIISLIASIQPLIRNVLRPPVQDMRNE
ncbi:MAG: hypothetical protein PWQ10_307 [Patescibacteria group bacterium]|nr:hypothetical protein [Patescibacteria group bacterium]